MNGYLIYGPQGSGKSTFAPYIAEKLGVSYLTTGQIFRDEMAKGTEVGKKVAERMTQGILIDDKTTWEVLEPRLEAAKNGFLLDGYPRNLNQVKTLEEKGYTFKKIFYMALAEEVAIKRLLDRGREDDTEEGIRTRLNFYKNQTQPVLDHYKQSGVEVKKIDNLPNPEVVRKNIDDYLKN